MKTNNLKYHETRVQAKGQKLRVDVSLSLNDECKNGHQDFAITANLYERSGSRWRDAGGGCCHEEILKAFPEFKIFVDLHLCDYLGNPMYADANGFYHLKEGMQGKQTFAEYYGMTNDQYNAVKDAEDQEHYNYLLRKSGVVKVWRAKAKKAIKLIEKLTDSEFVNDSTKTQFTPNPKEVDTKIKERIQEGYYTAENLAQRKARKIEDAKQKEIEGLKETAQKEIDKIKNKLQIKLHVLECNMSLDNFIYYNHENKGVFNWNDSTYKSKVSESEFNTFLENVDYNKLPEGMFFELKGVREFAS